MFQIQASLWLSFCLLTVLLKSAFLCRESTLTEITEMTDFQGWSDSQVQSTKNYCMSSAVATYKKTGQSACFCCFVVVVVVFSSLKKSYYSSLERNNVVLTAFSRTYCCLGETDAAGVT